MSYSRNVPVVVEWSDEQKQVHIRDVDDGNSVWTEVCTCTDEAGAMAVGDLLTERAHLRAELDRATKRDEVLEALKALAGCIEGYPDMMAEPAVAECMATALEALDAVGVSDE